ncbi:hypothetical protein [Empedobacter sp.]|uniref:hypothetical protein n=1 Tax=Empedobacter sp. TaxID=1927715 RepID=UPI002896B6F8|nr:hypothetical protein [Empedobacter sp.]
MALDNNTVLNYTDKTTIKNWFKTGLKPKQDQFWAQFDSYWHKSESLPISSITNLANLLDGKAEENHEHNQYATNDASSLSPENIAVWTDKLKNHEHSQYAKNDASSLTPEDIAAWRLKLEVQEGGTTTEDITSDYKLGGVNVADVIPSGTNTQKLAEFLLKGTFTPELIAPTLSLSQNAGATREIGESVQIVLTANFNRGDIKGALVGSIWNVNGSQGARAGVATAYKFMGVANGTTANKTITHVVVANTNSFTTEVSYGLSTIQPKNNKGENFDVPLPAGSLTASVTLTGRYKIFYGHSNVSTPARSLPQNTWANVNVFDLVATMGYNYFEIYVPATKELVSVFDSDIGNVDITSAYVDKGLITVNDAGGNAVSYRKYQMFQANPYDDKNHTHKVTLRG